LRFKGAAQKPNEALRPTGAALGAWCDMAPCVTFDKAARPVPIWEVFASPGDWSPAERERLMAYRMIGADGAGNPICVEQGSGAVVLLDHEDWFHSRQFVNSSVGQLAECLLAYMGEQDAARFRSAVGSIDPPALAEGALWWYEAACLDSDAEPLSGLGSQ
jgi:SUKH-4 immunity protein